MPNRMKDVRKNEWIFYSQSEFSMKTIIKNDLENITHEDLAKERPIRIRTTE